MGKEYPILFSIEMVRAILAGQKTQTRRVVTPQVSYPKPMKSHAGLYLDAYNKTNEWVWWGEDNRIYGTDSYFCPYGAPGDRLYVRESWNATSIDGVSWRDMEGGLSQKLCFNWNVRYKANPDNEGQKWLPSIFMPKVFARIWLCVTDVRVERAQDIKPMDCYHEGVDLHWNEPLFGDHSIMLFAELWDSINAKRGYGWGANPWVWVVEFERVQK